MTVEEAVQHRRSIHRFLPDAVPVTDLREMLALASQAPNVGNRQPWRFIVITDEHLRRMLGVLVERRLDEMITWPELANDQARVRAWKEQALYFVEAPAVVILVNQGYRSPLEAALVQRGMKLWDAERMLGESDIQSVSAVAAYLTLLAEARGYGTCWMTNPLIDKKNLQASLELKAGEEITAFIALGKPAENPPPKSRKPIDALIEWR